MVFVKGCDLSDEQKYEVSKIFSEGFYQWFKYFSKDIERLSRAFEDCFIWEKFYFAVIESRVCGMAAINDGKSPSVRLSQRKMIKNLGFFKGCLAYFILKSMFENHKYPFPVSEGTGSIEFVAVSEKFRRQGVASNLLKHIIGITNQEKYILEVADTNTAAVLLYKKLGFEIIYSVREKNPKRSGINNYLYMELTHKK